MLILLVYKLLASSDLVIIKLFPLPRFAADRLQLSSSMNLALSVLQSSGSISELPTGHHKTLPNFQAQLKICFSQPTKTPCSFPPNPSKILPLSMCIILYTHVNHGL